MNVPTPAPSVDWAVAHDVDFVYVEFTSADREGFFFLSKSHDFFVWIFVCVLSTARPLLHSDAGSLVGVSIVKIRKGLCYSMSVIKKILYRANTLHTLNILCQGVPVGCNRQALLNQNFLMLRYGSIQRKRSDVQRNRSSPNETVCHDS